MKNVAVFAVLAMAVSSIGAVTINVPADQPTIQAGINAASDGDTVLVAPGTYTGEGNRNLVFQRKSIVLMSVDGPHVTDIDCEASYRGFYLQGGANSSASIIGFTVRNGLAWWGSAIYSDSSNITIINCIFMQNTSSRGGAIYSASSELRMLNSVFNGNQAIDVEGGRGGAIYCSGGSLTLENCTFYDNYAGGPPSYGYGQGVFTYLCSVYVEKCIFWEGDDIDGQPPIQVTCSDLSWETEWAEPFLCVDGNFSLDPLFCDPVSFDFGIISSSPCAPPNNQCNVKVGARGVGCILGKADLEIT